MTSETLGALHMRRQTLERDLRAILRGDAGSVISTGQVSFYKLRLAAVNRLLTLRETSATKVVA